MNSRVIIKNLLESAKKESIIDSAFCLARIYEYIKLISKASRYEKQDADIIMSKNLNMDQFYLGALRQFRNATFHMTWLKDENRNFKYNLDGFNRHRRATMEATIRQNIPSKIHTGDDGYQIGAIDPEDIIKKRNTTMNKSIVGIPIEKIYESKAISPHFVAKTADILVTDYYIKSDIPSIVITLQKEMEKLKKEH